MAETLTLTVAERAEIEANRRRYEALKSAGQNNAPKALPGKSPRDAASIEGPTLDEEIPGGGYRALRLKRGEALRIVSVEGRGAVSLLAWNAADPSERYYHGDTVKVQWTAKLQKGRVLLSEMGRVLLSIIEDSSAAHDAVMGGSNAASVLEKFGAASRNARDNLIVAASKHGLGRQDVPPCITFFAPVAVGGNGRFLWRQDAISAGDFVDLRAEMDLLIALSNTPHPLDPSPDPLGGPVRITRFWTVTAADDPCRTATPEAARAFENTDAYTAELG